MTPEQHRAWDDDLAALRLSEAVIESFKKQLAAERAAREAAEAASKVDHSAWLLMLQAADGYQEERDAARAALAERDQQLAALRANADQMARDLVSRITNREDQWEWYCNSCGNTWGKAAAPSHTIDCPVGALLAPPAAVGDPEYQRFEAHMNRALNRPPAAVGAVEAKRDAINPHNVDMFQGARTPPVHYDDAGAVE